MSKIGQKIIEILSGVEISINNNTVLIKGQKGECSVTFPKELEIIHEKNTLAIKRKNDTKEVKSIHGLYRQLLYNSILGVNQLWQKKLEVVGTGFNVKLQGEDLVFKLGYSHPVIFKKVAGIEYKVEGNTKITISGINKQFVGQIAHQIKLLRKPDVYKGKGIRYEGEKLRIKPGKKAKAAAGATGA